MSQPVLDMLVNNKTEPQLNYAKSLATYSYPDMRMQDKDFDFLKASKQYVDTINKHVLGRDVSPYSVINQALYKGLMGKQKVMLGDMSETLYRRILGNSLTLEEMKDVFRFLTDKLQKMEEPVSYREAAHNFLPHIFQAPRDLYMAALLKETFQAATSICAFVGAHHYVPIQKYWVEPPYGVNIYQATRIPERISGEKDEELIEKHALMDSLLEKKAWGQGYVVNPFSYLSEDLSTFNDRDIAALKECFRFHYKKYEKFKSMNPSLKIPSYADRLIPLMEHRHGKRDEQLLLKIEEDRITFELKHEMNDLKKLKLDYWKQRAADNQTKLSAPAAPQ